LARPRTTWADKMSRNVASIEARTVAISAGSALLRVAEPADAAATIALRVAMAQESEFLSGEPGEIRTDIEAVADLLGKKLTSAVDLYLLAEVNDRCVGIASLDGSTQRRFEHGATLGLGVARDFWRRGLGRALVGALLDWADSRGLVRIALEVVETNVGAVRLYESLGFEHEGRLRLRRKHGGAYLDNHLMARIRPPTVVP
jgi:RimJ/RimL family protein N-acetyltransferase